MNSTILKQNLNLQITVLTISLVLFILKFTAYFLTNSILILSDALESIVNIIAAGIGSYSLYLSSIPKDETHPYGHGKVEFLTAGIEGGLICFAGLTIIYEAIRRFWVPSELHQLDTGLIFSFVTVIFNFLIGFFVKGRGIQNKNLQLISSGQHLITDSISTLVICLGIIIISFSQWFWLDNLLGILVGFYILFPAYLIIRNAIAGIMDEADKQLNQQFIEILKQNKNHSWIDIHNLKILKNGSVIHIDCHLTLPFFWTIEQANQEIQIIENLIKKEFGELAECSIQIDACNENLCKYCSITNCKDRKFIFQENSQWDYQKVTQLH